MRVLILGTHEVAIFNLRKELILALLEQGHEVTVSCPIGQRTAYFHEIGCDFEEIEVNRHSINPFHDLKLLIQYFRMIRRTRPDAVRAYTIKPNIWGGLASLILRKPYIVNVTGMGAALESPGIVQKLTKALYRISMLSVHKIFFQNQSNLDFFRASKIGHNRYDLVPGSGVNLEEFSPTAFPDLTDGALRFLFIGRIKKDKGIEEYLEVAQRVTRDFPSAHFGILGFFDGNYSERVQELVNSGVVDYYGETQDVKPFISDSHAIVLPSYNEGMANVLLEAGAMARPVIATDIPGCSETFEDGISGLACLPKSADSLERQCGSLFHFHNPNVKKWG